MKVVAESLRPPAGPRARPWQLMVGALGVLSRRIIRCWAVFGLLVSWLVVASGADDFESRVTEFRLSNGLLVLVYVDSSAPIVTVAVAYRIGSVYEPAGSTGISHMLEHMTFQRSTSYRPGEYFRIVKDAGGANNGFTSDYITAYYEVLSRENWELGLKLEAARMGHLILLDSDFVSEHQVVAEEQRLGENNPQAVFWREFNCLAQLAHPSRNPTIGWADDVARYTVGAVRDWYRRYYSPTNAVLVVAGDVTPEQVRVRAERYFRQIKPFPVVLPDFYSIEPEPAGERRLVCRKPVKNPRLTIAYPGPGNRDSAYFASAVAASILGQGRTSRLYQRLIVDSGLATEVSANGYSECDPSPFTISVTPKAESLIPRIERTIYAEIERLGSGPISERELVAVKNQTVASYVYERDATMWMAVNLASSQLVQGSWREFRRYPEQIGLVTAEQVQGFCRDYLRPERRTVGVLLPERDSQVRPGRTWPGRGRAR